MMMDNLLVIMFLCLPFMVFLGLKLITYRQQKKMRESEELDMIMKKHSEKNVFELPKRESEDSSKKKAA